MSKTNNQKDKIEDSSPSSSYEEKLSISNENESHNNYTEYQRRITKKNEECFTIHSILFKKKRKKSPISSDDISDDLKFIREYK